MEETVDSGHAEGGPQMPAAGRAAQLVHEHGVVFAESSTEIDVDIVRGLIDAGRR